MSNKTQKIDIINTNPATPEAPKATTKVAKPRAPRKPKTATEDTAPLAVVAEQENMMEEGSSEAMKPINPAPEIAKPVEKKAVNKVERVHVLEGGKEGLRNSALAEALERAGIKPEDAKGNPDAVKAECKKQKGKKATGVQPKERETVVIDLALKDGSPIVVMDPRKEVLKPMIGERVGNSFPDDILGLKLLDAAGVEVDWRHAFCLLVERAELRVGSLINGGEEAKRAEALVREQLSTVEGVRILLVPFTSHLNHCIRQWDQDRVEAKRRAYLDMVQREAESLVNEPEKKLVSLDELSKCDSPLEFILKYGIGRLEEDKGRFTKLHQQWIAFLGQFEDWLIDHPKSFDDRNDFRLDTVRMALRGFDEGARKRPHRSGFMARRTGEEVMCFSEHVASALTTIDPTIGFMSIEEMFLLDWTCSRVEARRVKRLAKEKAKFASSDLGKGLSAMTAGFLKNESADNKGKVSA